MRAGKFILCVLLCGLVHSRKITVATLGGSGTAWEESYPNVALPKALGDNFEITNYAKHKGCILKEPGSTKGCIPFMTTNRYQRALKASPDIITMMFGMNDAKEENWDDTAEDRFVSNYGELIENFKLHCPKAKIYLLTTQPLHEPWKYRMMKSVINGPLQKMIKKLAKSRLSSDAVIDVYTMLGSGNKRELSEEDGAHPNRAGHKKIAELIAKKLKEDGFPVGESDGDGDGDGDGTVTKKYKRTPQQMQEMELQGLEDKEDAVTFGAAWSEELPSKATGAMPEGKSGSIMPDGTENTKKTVPSSFLAGTHNKEPEGSTPQQATTGASASGGGAMNGEATQQMDNSVGNQWALDQAMLPRHE